ncbi:glycosyltransferase family 39 protein [bacterium]|nr:glycosyltransferase family 39 protein [bacterium]
MNLLKVKNRLNNEHLTLFGFTVLALVFRLFLMRYHFTIGWDEPHYLQLAVLFSKGQILQALHPYWSPFYSICIALFSFVIPNFELAGRIVTLICGILILIPVYLFTKELFCRVSGFWAVGLLTFYSPLAFSTTTTLAEPTLIFFVMMGIYFGWKTLRKNSLKLSIITGIFFGFSYLTKPEGIGYFVIFILFFGILVIFDHTKSKNRRLLSIGLGVVGFIFIATPYLLYLHQETGRWTISSKIYANQQFEAQLFNNEEINLDTLSDNNTINPIDAIYHEGNFLKIVGENRQETSSIDLSLIVKKYITNFYRITKYAIPQLFGFVLLSLLVLGFFSFALPIKEIEIYFYLLSFVGLFWFVMVPLFHINDRYLLPGLVICFVWMGHGAHELTVWLKRGVNSWIQKKSITLKQSELHVIAFFFVIGFISLFCYIPELGKVVSRSEYSVDFWEDAVELKKAGLWLKEHVTHEPILMSYNKSVDFYAGSYHVRKGVTFPDNDHFDRILAYANHRNVEYMVVSERYLGKYPNLRFLFDNEKVPAVLKLIYEDKKNEGLGVRVFKMDPKG